MAGTTGSETTRAAVDGCDDSTDGGTPELEAEDGFMTTIHKEQIGELLYSTSNVLKRAGKLSPLPLITLLSHARNLNTPEEGLVCITSS